MKRRLSMKRRWQEKTIGRWQGRFIGVWVLLLASCAPTLYVKQSFRGAVEVPVVKGTVALNRGETFEIDPILKKEGVTPKKVVVTKLFGRYLLTGDQFRHVWLISPAGREKASYQALQIVEKGRLVSPTFTHNEGHNCVTLSWGAGGTQKRQIDWSGRVGQRCGDVSEK